jgi:hypothetical protein
VIEATPEQSDVHCKLRYNNTSWKQIALPAERYAQYSSTWARSFRARSSPSTSASCSSFEWKRANTLSLPTSSRSSRDLFRSCSCCCLQSTKPYSSWFEE